MDLLFSLRVVASVALFAFVLAVFWLLWRDLQSVNREIASRTIKLGRLVVIHSEGVAPLLHQEYALRPLTRLGRSPANTVRIDNAFTSAEHAAITLKRGRWWLEDLGSSNGTQVNDYRISEPVILTDGDVISIGQVAMRFETG